MSASTHSMSRLDRKMVPSMSNTATLRLAAGTERRLGWRGTGAVFLAAHDSPAADGNRCARLDLPGRTCTLPHGVQKVVARVLARNRDDGQLGVGGATGRRENSGRPSRAAVLHALLRDPRDRLGWREAGDVR